ncbi:diguanylate cyclase [Vibrio sp. TRT 17S01]|uniref:diguanylate cyclase n=1 Tax=Vibrio sp. TRT 17S01 TaxID=3418505 RepID=UPI003CEB1D21
MNKLSVKVFLILLPLAISIVLFSYAYYQAREKIIIDHVFQSSQLAATLGAHELGHSIEGRFDEFDRLSLELNRCFEGQRPIAEMASSALSYGNGFSALIVSDLNGIVSFSTLSPNSSNRYVLRQNILNTRVLSDLTVDRLYDSYEQWSKQYPEAVRQEREVENAIYALKNRGEENSAANRELNSRLLVLRERKQLPKTIVELASSDKVADLGLIFETETYFYSRPMLNCKKELIGFYTVVLDKTQVEDQLFEIKKNLLANDFKEVDVALVLNENMQLLSATSYLKEEQLARHKINQTSQPQIRNDLGGVLVNINIPVSLKRHLVHFRYAPNAPDAHKYGVSMLVFVPMQELEKQCDELLREVLLYLMITLILFIILTLSLSRYIAAPIAILRRRVGDLSMGRKVKTEYMLRDDEIGDLFNAFSSMASTIKHKESQLVELVRQDPLTGVLNRRALLSMADDIRRMNIPACVCMLDLDHFKTINDTYGHPAGDAVLKTFCTLVSSEIRGNDVFGRMGGEEFALILPETSLEYGVIIAERIRHRVESQLLYSLGLEHAEPVTVSIGITEWQSTDVSKALSAADRCLYKAKNRGRNLVIACE